MTTAIRELRYAVRRLRATPMFTTSAIAVLAIAIGATASAFSVVDGVLFKAVPYRDLGRILGIFASNPTEHLPRFPFSAPDYVDYRAQSTAFSSLAAASARPVTVTGVQRPERLWGIAVTPNWFATMGLTPALGRFLAQDSLGPAEVVISYGFWQQRFGGLPSVLGRALALDGQPYTIVGVMPAGYFGAAGEVWTRLSFTARDFVAADTSTTERFGRARHFVFVYGRLRDGVTPEFAQSELQTIARRLAAAYPATNQNWSAVAEPVLQDAEGAIKPALIALLAAAGCVLLIGAANLANLFLVRCLARDREMAVRTAMGATRGRLARELLTEAATLGLVGGTLGVGVAVAGAHALRLLAPSWLPRLSQVDVDGRVVAFCAVTSIATVLVFGVLPAWQSAQGNLAHLLKEGGRATGSARRQRLQDVFVVLQVAVALVLLTSAGLLVEGFDHFRRMDPGFQPNGVLTAEIDLPVSRYPTPERQAAYARRLVQQLVAAPGVQDASVSDAVPGVGGGMNGLSIVGDPPFRPGAVPTAYAIAASPDYFRTMGIRQLRGRGISTTDDRRAPRIAVIDDHLARQLFAGRDPLGRRIALRDSPDTFAIVGVVASVLEDGLATSGTPTLYVPFAQLPSTSGYVAVRAQGDPSTTSRLLSRSLAAIDSDVPVSDVETMSERMSASVGTNRFSTFLASLFAVIALILGAVGIYSVLAYIVSQRRRDIAIRIALGARPADVMAGVLARAVTLSITGIILGSLTAWWLTQFLDALFLGASPHDPAVFVGAAAVFVVVALTAASVPAFRTTRVSPVVALTST